MTPRDLLALLCRSGLAGKDESPAFARLPGGVSSDIWRVDLARGPVCIKRALPKLKVRARWQAPVARNAYEVAWIETAGAIEPAAVAKVLFHDPRAGLFVMDYLDPARYACWKDELKAGRADPAVAEETGRRLAQIHSATAGRPEVARRFPTDAIFHAIRLEPYLEATARAHPDLAGPLAALVETTARTRRALVHGDISPKNILVGPEGPVFVDAECAWYGDPAFDLAFCLNHFLLKCLWRPGTTPRFLACFDAMVAAYGENQTVEPWVGLEARAARLLPGLLLARVDGKSPVEYLVADADKDRVRLTARRLLEKPVSRLAHVRAAWQRNLGP